MSIRLSMPVLVVDDHPIMVSIVSTLLKQIGFACVDDARNAVDALKKMQGKNYGLVISDGGLKPGGGGELLRKIRANPRTANTPFLLLTANGRECDVVAPCAKIEKPFNARMLHQHIETLLAA